METTLINNKKTVFTGIDVEQVRQDFPLLQIQSHGKPIAFLDNGASSQKPQAVLDALITYYKTQNTNIHRGVYELSQLATEAYENARIKVKDFIGAKSEKEIIFVRGTTEGINLVVNSYGRQNIKEDDEIIISTMEHHSNIVPWQMLCEEKGAKLRIIPIDDNGELEIPEFVNLINEHTKFVSVVHVSNSLGTINPVKKLIDISHDRGIPVLLDGAQAAPHQQINVQELGCDFYTFSGHKMYGPTGIGVLYGRETMLDAMAPFQGGGDMIKSVTFEKTTYNDLPYKFEAGTPNIAGTIGLAAAIDYIISIGYDHIAVYEEELLAYATKALLSIDDLKIIGTAENKASLISFVIEGIHPHDIGQFLDYEGIAVRTGHHCTQPVMERFNVPATTRASFAFYNTKEEVDRLVAAIRQIKEFFVTKSLS